MKRVAFHTLGCRLNQCETAQMEQVLAARGWEIGPWDAPATVRVLNTCTVTGKTDRECRRLVRRAKRADPDGRVVVTGCYAQVAPDKVAAIEGVELVLGNVDKLSLAHHLDRLLDNPVSGCAATAVTEYDDLDPASGEGELITHFSGYTRAFLKVQNGCDSRCSYCVIPFARGPSRSLRLATILDQIDLLCRRGFREIVLTGIHIGAWGKDTREGDLADLISAVFRDTPLERLRLSSTEPMELTDRVLAAAKSGGFRFAEHFHVPLQSGADSVLRRMNRTYRREEYAARIAKIREHFPEAALGADVIVGFPGETDEEFQETVDLIERLPLTYLHVFAYSDRPGTRAEKMADKVDPEKIKQRSRILRSLGEAKRRAFEASFRGREMTALALSQRTDDGRRVALTGNYIEIAVPDLGSDRAGGENCFVQVKPLAPREDGRWEGILLEPRPV